MSQHHGVGKCEGIESKYLELDRVPNWEFVDVEDTSTEVFRGFDKRPAVLIERIDITPFLPAAAAGSPSQEPPQKKINKPTLKPILKVRNYTNFSNNCTVHLFNDDLNKLKEIFNKKLDVFDNLTLRAPSNMSLKCKICKKIYSSEKKLHNHQANKHMIVKARSKKRVSFSDKVVIHELKEYHKCRKCPKIFESYRMLKGHMKEQHKKRKCYICNYCTKNFVDRMFFKVHIKLHCDACGQLFSSKTKCTDHRRNVCKTLKYHKCKTCELNFFKLMDLKDHSYEHNSRSCFVCDICKDQCYSKCAVSHHIYFLHSKKPKKRNISLYITKKLVRESLFLCKFCEETTLDKDLIERHVELLPDLTNRAMTGYKDYYFCDQCLKQFDTETDMLQHKWTHFLKTPDNSQERTQCINESGNGQEMTNESKNGEVESNECKNFHVKTIYNVNGKIPEHFQPKVVLNKLKDMEQTVLKEPVHIEPDNVQSANVHSDNVHSDNVHSENKYSDNVHSANEGSANENPASVESVNVPSPSSSPGIQNEKIKNPKPKKTILSKHQCQNCGKYYSSNYSLNRHIESMHGDYENLRCKVCEEVFVWPSLLRTHKCIRLKIPEMPFDDARPEIHFDNLSEIAGVNDLINGEALNGFDDLNIDSENYINSVDFDIPAPIVDLAEQQAFSPSANGVPVALNQHVNKMNSLQNLGYKIVMQEVPIEF